jgi:RNA polymerase sigma factor (sigma-70 family)
MNLRERHMAFHSERVQLRSLAFRILNSESDAEDVVQEAWIRYERADPDEIRNPAAWLTTVTTRLCLDVLRRRREVPTEQVPSDGRSDGPGPEELVMLAGELTSAFAIVLEELTPPQRVAFVLHDVFGVPFDEVADVLATTTASAKKLASRARGRVRRGRPGPSDGPTEDARHIVEAFLHAARDGDTDRLVRLLDPDVVRTADPQALPDGAAQRVRGVQAVVAETRALQANARRARVATIDGWPGIVVAGADAPLQAALVIHIAGDRVVHYDVIADPRRLALLHIEG